MAKIEASRAAMEGHAQANEELCKTNEELRNSLHQHFTRERPLSLPTRNIPKPFSKEIVDELVPTHYIISKIAFFTRIDDVS